MRPPFFSLFIFSNKIHCQLQLLPTAVRLAPTTHLEERSLAIGDELQALSNHVLAYVFDQKMNVIRGDHLAFHSKAPWRLKRVVHGSELQGRALMGSVASSRRTPRTIAADRDWTVGSSCVELSREPLGMAGGADRAIDRVADCDSRATAQPVGDLQGPSRFYDARSSSLRQRSPCRCCL